MLVVPVFEAQLRHFGTVIMARKYQGANSAVDKI